MGLSLPSIARAAAVAATVVALTGCAREAPPTSSAFANHAPGVRYLGIDACVGCHKDKAETFAHTGMGRSAFPMAPAVAVEDFTRNNEIEIVHQGKIRYRMTEREGKFFMRQLVADASGADSFVDEREIEWVIGSGNHSRSYVTRVGSKLFQMPVCWYPQIAQWDLCPGYEDKNDHFSREISESCVFCHNARMELVPGARNEYQEPIPAGIDCERCHGPGELHVKRWRDGTDEPSGGVDPTIVNPARLPAPQRIQICFQCHLGDSKATERVARPGRALADWRPGAPITDAMVPFWMSEPSRHHFGISAQADRFLRSRCVTQSGGRLECLSCHDPHVSVYGAQRPATAFRDACLKCHVVGDCKAPDAQRHATTPLSDDCVACHMPRSEPDDHRHTTFTDHWIRVPEPKGAAEPLRHVTLEPIVPEAYEALSSAERAYVTGRAYFLKSLDFPDSIRKEMWRTAEDSFRSAIRESFHPAESWFFLGKLMTYQRRSEEAAAAFRSAVALDPTSHDATLALGTALIDLSSFADAERVLRAMLQRWPDDAGALAELARCTAASEGPAAAVELMDRAIAAQPWTATLHMNRALMLLAGGRRADALAACGEARRLDPVSRRIRETCSGL